MNERLKHLALQATRHSPEGFYTYQQIDPEKFAELIVDQMLDITDAHTEVFQTDRDKALIEHIKQSIKQHFGVKK